jgi:SAM-dependent methyltransferase
LVCSPDVPPASRATLAAPTSAVEALLAEWGKAPADARMVVDPADEMLAFLHDLHGGDSEQALCAYYASGASIAAVVMQVLRWRFGEPRRAPSVLDFASGYGRVTRFLLNEVPPEAVTVSDILPAALAFQRRAFGVRGIASSAKPADLPIPGAFAAILVNSLFTHLPGERFTEWLAALLGRLAPGGVLLFSTHDLSLLHREEQPAAGIRFDARSEIATLSGEDYGSTWVDEPFVRAALARTGLPLAAVRFERALVNYQDLWVVVLDPAETFAGLVLQSEPEVVVEECRLSPGQIEVAGWSHARHGGVARVEVSLGGVSLGAGAVSGRRPDVAAVLGPSAADAGWRILGPVSAAAAQGAIAVLRAVDPRGAAWPRWVGRLDSLRLQASTLHERELRAELYRTRCELAEQRALARQQIAELRARVAAMEASRFWKLRNAWFRLKRALRLTDEP